MAIKNYTSEIKVETTVMEIEKILAKGGAKAIMKEYDDEGEVSAVVFQSNLPNGSPAGFKLPYKETAMLNIIRKIVDEGKLPRKFRNDPIKARKVGWRIIKDWIASQMALVEIELCDLAEVFLPYAWNGKQTAYEVFQDGGFKMLEAPSDADYEVIEG